MGEDEVWFVFLEGNKAFDGLLGESLYNIGWMPSKRRAEQQAKQEIRSRRQRGESGPIRFKVIAASHYSPMPFRLVKKGRRWVPDEGAGTKNRPHSSVA